jgi:N-acetylglucosaminyldiphosphoundecaprenol N-acetyl-beta-D-mannosaminyltransferase
MGFSAVKILEISVTISPKKEILEELEKRLFSVEKSASKTIRIVTPNPEQLVLAQHDKQFIKILNRADVAVPDGIGLVWAHGVLGEKDSLTRIPGVELMGNLVGLAAKKRVTIALIGGRDSLAIDALKCLQVEYPSLEGVAHAFLEVEVEDGKLKTDRSDDLEKHIDDLVHELEQRRVRMVFIALGAPKQEYLMEALAARMKKFAQPVILMSVGGSFEIIAGRIPRAPQWMRSFGIEWLWRLLREPWRWKRQLALIEFVWLIFKKRFALR